MDVKAGLEIINGLKNEAMVLYEVYAIGREVDIAQAIHKIVDAINIIERKVHGQAITTVYDLK